MQQLNASLNCDNTASYIFIGVFQPKKPWGSCCRSDLITNITSIAVSYSRFSSTAVLKSTNSNNVAILSVWKKDARLLAHVRVERKDSTFSSRIMARLQSLFSKRSSKNVHPEALPASLMIEFEKALRKVSHVIGMSWYEFSCGDCKELQPATQLNPDISSSSLSAPQTDEGPSRVPSSSSNEKPTPVSRSNSSYKLMGNVSASLSLNSCQDLIEDVESPTWSTTSHSTLHEDNQQEEDCAGSSSCVSFQSCSDSSLSTVPTGPLAWCTTSHSPLHEDSQQKQYCAGSSSRVSFQSCSESSLLTGPIVPLTWSTTSDSPLHEDSQHQEYWGGSSSRVSVQSCSISSLSTVPIEPVSLSVGDIVHLRCVEKGRSKILPQDMLSYSCLAILKAYFAETEGLRSYTFYRSLDGTKVAGLGVWQDAITASNFLNAPDGAREESYWTSMGASTRFEIYEVAILVA